MKCKKTSKNWNLDECFDIAWAHRFCLISVTFSFGVRIVVLSTLEVNNNHQSFEALEEKNMMIRNFVSSLRYPD